MEGELKVLRQMSMREAAALLVMEVEQPKSSGLGEQACAVRSRPSEATFEPRLPSEGPTQELPELRKRAASWHLQEALA